MKHVLITGGAVAGNLDSNKRVSNRARGIWATGFAKYLSLRGYKVTLLLSDSALDITTRTNLVDSHNEMENFTWDTFGDFWEYKAKCEQAAHTHDAAVMAAAVTNWIPKFPIQGKMETKGFKAGDVIQVPFELAPNVIDQMKKINPTMTLIGCKLQVGVSQETLVEAAYELLLRAKCDAVVANDLTNLKCKYVVNKDRTVQTFEGFRTTTVAGELHLYAHLSNYLEDTHFSTIEARDSLKAASIWDYSLALKKFKYLLEKNRHRLLPVESKAHGDMAFGSLAVRCGQGWLVSPRRKTMDFSEKAAAYVQEITPKHEVVVLSGFAKASLNAPLLIRYGEQYSLQAVLHFHEQIEGLPTLGYAPPGTVRDNMRPLNETYLHKGFNIEGHGCILPVYNHDELYQAQYRRDV